VKVLPLSHLVSDSVLEVSVALLRWRDWRVDVRKHAQLRLEWITIRIHARDQRWRWSYMSRDEQCYLIDVLVREGWVSCPCQAFLKGLSNQIDVNWVSCCKSRTLETHLQRLSELWVSIRVERDRVVRRSDPSSVCASLLSDLLVQVARCDDLTQDLEIQHKSVQLNKIQ